MYNTRPKINPKVIFSDILEDTKNSLVIGSNNSDIVEILKQKRIKLEEFEIDDENKIIEFLSDKDDKNYDSIILNFELCNYNKIKDLLNKLLEKSKYSIIRFRNHNHHNKITKKKMIAKIIKSENIYVIKKFYSKRNFVSKSIFFRPFAYYSIYFIAKEEQNPIINTTSTKFKLNPLSNSVKKSLKLTCNK